MQKISRIMLVGLAGLVLAGCSPSVEDLVEDSDKRRQILKECADMGLAAKDEEKCKTAAKAELEAGKKAAGEMMDSLKK